MKFEYNANLSMVQRIKLVTDEIMKHYPLIDPSAAKMSAILSSSIDDKPTNSEKFERYYFLLMYLNPNNDEYIHVFNDMYNVYESGIEEEQYSNCMEEIIKYFSHTRETFPLLEEFY